MSDEKISIRITDGIDKGISANIKDIAKQASVAHSAVTKLQGALKSVSGSAGLSKLQAELARVGLAQEKLATQINKTNTAYLNSENALNRAIAAEAKATAATTQLTTAQINSAAAAQRLAAAQAQNAAATAQAQAQTANAATAHIRTATAQTQSQIAAQGLATATARTALTQTQGQAAAARLAAAQTATGTAASNAAAAADRAALAALRLSQAQARAAQQTQAATSSLWQYARAGATVLGAGFGAKAIIDIGDAYTILQNKLQNVTTSQAQVNRLTEKLFELANKTRTPIDATTTAFARFDRALKILGKSQEESLRLTETVNKALVVSGATTGEAASALLQLSQGFNAGRLMGDEFRAVAENMPAVLDAVAKVLNTPINKIKQLASEGKITSKVLFDAFKLMEGKIDATFAKTLPTVAQSMVIAKNRAIEFFGELNKSVGFTAALSSAILLLSNNVDILAAGLAVAGTALLVVTAPQILIGINAVARGIAAMSAALAANPIGLLIVGMAAAISLFALFADKLQVTSDGLVSFGDLSRAVWSYVSDYAKIAIDFISDAWNALTNFIGDKLRGLGSAFASFGMAIINHAKTTINNLIGTFAFGFKVISELWKAGPTGFRKVFSEIDTIASEAFEKDYLGDIGKSVASGFDAVTKGLMDRAREISKARRLASEVEKTPLRGAGKDLTGGDEDNKRAKQLKEAAKILQDFNRDLEQQSKLLQLLPKQREVEQQIMQLQNKLAEKEVYLTGQQIAGIRERLELLQEQNAISQEVNKIYGETQGAQADLKTQVAALDIAFASGFITLDQYSNKLVKLGVDMANLKLAMGQGEFADAAISSLGRLVEGYNGALAGMSTAFGNFFQSFSDGFANSVGRSIVYWQDFGNAVKNVAKEAIAGLITSMVKLGIQFAINAALGKSIEAGALAAHTAMSTSAAAATAAAWAPAAAMTSLASFGANAAPANAGLTATASLSQSLALSSLKGFMDGGWTGNMARDEIAGVVHGKEYVMDAATTSRIGVDNLSALQSGAASVQRNGTGGEVRSGASIAHNGDVIIPVTMPAGTSRREASEVGTAIAEAYIDRIYRQKRIDKEAEFFGVKLT